MRILRKQFKIGSFFGRETSQIRRVAGFTAIFTLILIAVSRIGLVAGAQESGGFRDGEKLTYSVSYDRFKNAGFAEIQVVSRGKLKGRDAVELRSRIKTNEVVAAAFYMVDEARTVFADPDSGLPLWVQVTNNLGVVPERTVRDGLDEQNAEFDMLSLMFRIRRSGGSGNFRLFEKGRAYEVAVQSSSAETVKTDAGDFETDVSVVQSEFLSELGLSDLRINFTRDEQKLPVLIRFQAGRGEFRASLAAYETAPEPAASPTPTPTRSPVVSPTATPKRTPLPYVNNEPLDSELPFVLGEALEFKIASNGQDAGNLLFEAKERKQITANGRLRDSLLLSASVTGTPAGSSLMRVGDSIKTWVSPDDLQPFQVESKVDGGLAFFNQNLKFDQDRGTATAEANRVIQIPVNTHSLVSLFYAIRSFNLRPSKSSTNPVNDTRVAVLLGDQFYVFMLRPADAQAITLGGEKVSAQMISVFTGNPQFDAMNIRLWLSNDRRRTPLRFAVGAYQADLISQRVATPD